MTQYSRVDNYDNYAEGDDYAQCSRVDNYAEVECPDSPLIDYFADDYADQIAPSRTKTAIRCCPDDSDVDCLSNKEDLVNLFDDDINILV